MSRIGHWLVHQSVTHLLRIACVAALLALSLMAYSVISLKPLPVVFAMSVGHGIGIFAFLCYLLAVILDTRRSTPRPSAAPSPPAERAKAAKDSSPPEDPAEDEGEDDEGEDDESAEDDENAEDAPERA